MRNVYIGSTSSWSIDGPMTGRSSTAFFPRYWLAPNQVIHDHDGQASSLWSGWDSHRICRTVSTWRLLSRTRSRLPEHLSCGCQLLYCWLILVISVFEMWGRRSRCDEAVRSFLSFFPRTNWLTTFDCSRACRRLDEATFAFSLGTATATLHYTSLYCTTAQHSSAHRKKQRKKERCCCFLFSVMRCSAASCSFNATNNFFISSVSANFHFPTWGSIKTLFGAESPTQLLSFMATVNN